MKDEAALLRACLEHDGIGSEAGDAFSDMLERLESGRYKRLTEGQRSYLMGVCSRLGIEPGAENLVTEGKVKPTRAERESLRQFHESLGPKVLKPPGRRAQ